VARALFVCVLLGLASVADPDSRGISIPGVVGGVFGCLFAIAGAAILYKTWRVLEVKRRGRNRKELVMLGGGMTAP
jgi:hypothetical protein